MLASAAPFTPLTHRLVAAQSGDLELSPRNGKTACTTGRLSSSSGSTVAEEFSDGSLSSPASSRSSSPSGNSDVLKELGLVSPTQPASILVASHTICLDTSVVHAADYRSAVGTQVAPDVGYGILSTSGARVASQRHCSLVEMRREQRDMTLCPSPICDGILSTSAAPAASQKYCSLVEMRREQHDMTMCPPAIRDGILSTSGGPAASQKYCSLVEMRREQRDMTMCPPAIRDGILSTSSAPAASQEHGGFVEMRREQRDRTMCSSATSAALLSSPPGLEPPPGLAQTATQFLSNPVVLQTTEEVHSEVRCMTAEQAVRAAIDIYKPHHVRGSYCGKGLKTAKLPEGTPVKKLLPKWVV